MNDGDRVRVETPSDEFEGVLLPSTDKEQVVLKLDDGYNIGLERDKIDVEVIREGESIEKSAREEESELIYSEELPTISLISTGGTIASTVDYRTGAVTARFTAEDVLNAVPELEGLANYHGRVVANILSENMTPSHWQRLAEAIHTEIENGADGVVVMHGTDTMQHTASALSYMIESPVPIVFVGSQRSADRPSSDNVVNAVCAVEAAKSDIAEVMVCMHRDETDDVCALHRGTRVRKNHTSRRDAFETIGGEPLAEISYETREIQIDNEYQTRAEVDLEINKELETDVAHIKYLPGMPPDILDFHSDKEGIILEGTGLGHVNTDWIPHLEEMDQVVVMTSQCIEGRVCDRVYDTGRDLLDAGVVEAEDTIPETAYVKLMWVLANKEEPGKAMSEDIAGEITESSRPWI